MAINYQPNGSIKKATGWMIVLSIALMMIGLLAVLSPMLFSGMALLASALDARRTLPA
jgi:uncharacterized membrane protein HdeD (DUF308 family)